jgi:hypothetical protein
MKAYIKQTTETSLFEQAKIGFIKMGYECIYYKDLPNDLTKEDVVVGYIGDMQRAFIKLGITLPETIDYPQELEPFLGRKIIKIKYQELPINKFPYFIKPLIHKAFTGKVVREFKDLIGIPETDFYYTEDILNILSEYRVYIHNKQIIGIKNYKGNPFITPNEGTILNMINSYTSQLNTYTLDVGVSLVENKYFDTILIEANQGYSVGNYGLSELQYAKFLRDGWFQYLK